MGFPGRPTMTAKAQNVQGANAQSLLNSSNSSGDSGDGLLLVTGTEVVENTDALEGSTQELLSNETGADTESSLFAGATMGRISEEQEKAVDLLTGGPTGSPLVVEDAGKGYPGVAGDYGTGNESGDTESKFPFGNPSPMTVYGEDGVGESMLEVIEDAFGDFYDELFEDLGIDFDNPIDQDPGNPETILREKGLIRSRPEIIGITEFKPIQDDVNDLNESTIKIAVDTVNEKKVTNIARLIELHRQIRDFILSSSKIIKDKIYGNLNSKDLFRAMKNVFNAKYTSDDILKPTLSESIDSVIDFYINGEYETAIDSFTSQNLKEIAQSRNQNTYFRGLVEFIILDAVVIEMTKNFAKIKNFADSTNKAWSLKDYVAFKDFNPDDSISNSIVEEAFYENNITGNGNFYKDITGIQINDNRFEQYQQLGASLVSELCCFDSVTFSNGFKKNKTFDGEDGKIQIGLQGDMIDIFKELRRIVAQSYGGSSFTSISGNQLRIDEDNIFEIYKGVKNKDGQNVNDSLINLSECIISFIFYNTIMKVTNKVDTNDLFGLTNFKDSRPGNVIRYCQENFEIPGVSVYSLNKNSFDVSENVNNLSEETFIGLGFKPRQGITLEDTEVDYSPLLFNNTNNYMGGFKYFVSNLEKNRKADFKSFKNDYYSGANDFIRTFYSYFPDYKISEKFPFENLTDEQIEQAAAVNYNPLLNSNMTKEAIKFIEALKNDLESMFKVTGNFMPYILLIGRSDNQQILRVISSYYWRYYQRSLDPNSTVAGKATETSEVPQNISGRAQRNFFREAMRRLYSTSVGGTLMSYGNNNDINNASEGSVGVYNSSTLEVTSNLILSDPFNKGNITLPSVAIGSEEANMKDTSATTNLAVGLDKLDMQRHVNLELITHRGHFDNMVNLYEEAAGIFKFSFEQYFYIMFMTARWLLRKSIYLTAHRDGQGKVFFKSSGSAGLLKGLEDAILEIENDEEISVEDDANEDNVNSYDIGKQFAKKILESINYKQDVIRDHLAAIAGHASAIAGTYDNFTTPTGAIQDLINNTIQNPNLKTNSDLPDSFLSDRISNYNNSFTATDFHTNRKKFFITDSNLIPTHDRYILNKSKMMYNILTQEGYGLLKSEKFGNKEILNVGLTKGLIDYLKTEATLTTDNPNYEKSPYVAISVFKQSHFNDNITYDPKIFIFDTSINIEDYDIDGITRSNHLLNYNDDMTVDQMIENIQVNRYLIGLNNEIITDVKIGSEACFNKDILINHIFDYMLKEYQKILTGLDYSESSFLLRENPIPPRLITPGLALGDDIVAEIQSFIFKVEKIYGRLVGNDLRSELFRMINLVKQSYPFANKSNFERIVTPKMFDKTYSILINEKDFILNNNIAYEGGDYRLFKDNQLPNYSPTSKLLKVSEETFSSTASSIVNNYLYESKEQSITSNNYFVNVGILPINFTEESDVLFNQIVGI
jgi:hypothetical protein